jgi:outer membrane protein assembly factor BamB
VCTTGTLPLRLDPATNLLWKTPLPPAYSSPVLNGDALVVTAAEDLDLATICLDQESGALRWRTPAPRPLEAPPRGPNSAASPSPACDGRNVYVLFQHFGLVSYDDAGRERWTLPLEPLNIPYGVGTSPLVHEGLLILQCDQDTNSYLLGVDAESGQERWRTRRPGFTHGFSTPVIWRPQGAGGQAPTIETPAHIVTSGSYQVVGYSSQTGERLWWMTGMAWQAKSVPLVEGNTLYVHSWMAAPSEFGIKSVTAPWDEAVKQYDADSSGGLSKAELADLGMERLWFLFDLDKDGALDAEEWGYLLARGTSQNGLYAIRLGAAGDLAAEQVLWRYGRALPNIPSPLLHEGVLYVLKEGGILTALDPETGDVHKSERIEGAEDDYFASPVAAGGRILTASHEGRLAVIMAGAQWEVLSVSELGEEIWATPALAPGRVFVRTQKAMYCFTDAAAPQPER